MQKLYRCQIAVFIYREYMCCCGAPVKNSRKAEIIRDLAILFFQHLADGGEEFFGGEGLR